MSRANPSILLVDHTSYLRDRVGDALVSDGYTLHEADSASECLDRLRREDVGGVLTSYALVDLNGVRLSRSIRIIHPNLPVILAPEHGSETISSAAIDAGITSYISQDLDPHAIVSLINESLDQTAPWVDEDSAKRYHHLLEVSPVPINLFDATGETIWCNQAVLDLLGLDTRDELIGTSIFEYIHPDFHDPAQREIRQVIKQKESVGPTEITVRRKDGTFRDIYISTAVGKFLGEDIGQAIAIDITPLRAVEQELETEQRFIDTALDSLSDVFYVINEAYELEQWNQAAEDIIGRDTIELAQDDVLELFVDEDHTSVKDSIETVIETGADTVEAAIMTQYGRRELYELRGRRLDIDRSSGTTLIVGIGRNITEQRERERQLTVLGRWLRHNIRNDLNVIQGNAAEILEEPDTVPEKHARLIHEHAEHLIEQADHQRNVVDTITDPHDLLRIHLPPVIRDVVKRTQERCPTVDVGLTIEAPVTVIALPVLEETLAELLENAIKHNDTTTPTVTITVASDDDHGTIRLADNGPGIPDMETDELFVDKKVTQIHHGSGFGLFLAYWMTRMSGGTMDISPNSPRGTIITISLPTTPPEH